MSKSTIFTAYNAAKTLDLDRGRLNRGLGIAQSHMMRKYETTSTSCTCADHRYRSVTCKHMISLMLTVAS